MSIQKLVYDPLTKLLVLYYFMKYVPTDYCLMENIVVYRARLFGIVKLSLKDLIVLVEYATPVWQKHRAVVVVIFLVLIV